MSSGQHLLIVEDEPSIRVPLKRFLEREAYRVTAVADAAAARDALPDGDFALAILDIMMPGEAGLSLARWIRAQGDLPLLFLSARAEDIDRIIGLEMGGDDYLTKPFNPRELLARVRSIIRRSAITHAAVSEGGKRVAFGPFVADLAAQELRRDGTPVDLTAGEFRLLSALVQRPGRTLSRDQLLDLTQGRDAEAFDRAIDNAILRVRRKLGPEGATYIRTARGIGSAFVGDSSD
jgi:two-component system OmpR family response regulator